MEMKPLILALTLTMGGCDPQGRKRVQDTALNVALTIATIKIHEVARK